MDDTKSIKTCDVEIISKEDPCGQIEVKEEVVAISSPEDMEAQRDEMMAMESIIGSDQFTLYEGAILSGKILIDLNVSDDFKIKDVEKGSSVHIKHLPPISLHFTLPATYPSSEFPKFTLTSEWLDRELLSKLCWQLDAIANANSGQEVLYQWFSFLKENALESLNIDDSYDPSACSNGTRAIRPRLHNDEVNGTPRRGSNSTAGHSNNGSSSIDTEDTVAETTATNPSPVGQEDCEAAGTSSSSSNSKLLTESSSTVDNGAQESSTVKYSGVDVDAEEIAGPSSALIKRRRRSCKKPRPVSLVRDRRAVFDTRGGTLEPGSVLKYLIEYDYEEQEREFSRSVQSCDICLTDKMGSEFLRLKCDHAFCNDCIQSGYKTHIKDGAVDNIKCLAHKCSEVPSIAQVRAAVGEELFQRYDAILLQRALEKMGDLIYCPRRQCMKPVIRDPNDTLAQCGSCGYKFCCVCKMVYHGVEPCRFKSEERKRLFEEYTHANKQEKEMLEKTFGTKQLKLLVETTLSEKWVEKQSKPCPHCKVPIEKFEGCNKVTCLKCNSFFCWICLKHLDRANPYHHFNDPMSSCYQNLFENGNDDRDEDGDEDPEFDDDEDEDFSSDEEDDEDDEEWRREDDIRFQAIMAMTGGFEIDRHHLRRVFNLIRR